MLPDAVPPLPPTEALMHEARAVHDVATLQLSDYRIQAGSSWIVATLAPAADSGAATIPGAYVEAETGQLVNVDQHEPVVMKQGRWQAQAAGDAQAPTQGRYAWTEPMDRPMRKLAPEDLYSPFAHGGTVLFQWRASDDGAPPRHAHLLFPEWAPYAAQALRASAHLSQTLAEVGAAAPARAEATQLVVGPNAVSATLAFRALLGAADGFAAQAPALLEQAEPRRLSTFVYLGLTAAPATDRARWSQVLSRQVTQSTQPERLLAMAHGAYAAALFASEAQAHALALLDAIHTRVRALGIASGAGTPWQALFANRP